ncbi:MAG TPA: chemotaxis protein CheA [Sulfurospirillum sp. UBA12182]|jgi:two-component system chemotaxis sensor kinase CheA|nr:MAG TPA: chemotaxis protein CheA [Sulfurospirillum sp. UBA12182]
MSREKLKQIFIEEATEIIEKLDIDILEFEEDPSNKSLLDEIFRGVHTLKGSANAFNFTRLGEFVHHFEDALDYFRSADEAPTTQQIDLFLDGINVIKNTLEYEIQENEEFPQGYVECLDGIHKILENITEAPLHEELATSSTDLAEEFSWDEDETKEYEIENFFEELQESEELFEITLKFDDDIYLRGFDHFLFFKNLSGIGRILCSYWHMNLVGDLHNFDVEKNNFKEVKIAFATKSTYDEILEIFDFVEEEEFHILHVKPKTSQKEIEEVQEIQEENINTTQKEAPVKEEVQTSNNQQKTQAAVTPTRSFLKIDSQKLDELFDSIGELVIAQNYLAQNQIIKQVRNAEVSKTIENLSKITRLIQNRVMSLRMIPIRDTFAKMKRVARDSSKKVGKEINLVLEGEDTEIDKTMVDALSDPLIHIIRNSIDHGIESDSQERLKAGKDEKGNVTLSAYHRGGNIIIEIKDDGRGINKEKVYKKALERGIISPEDELSDSQVYNLIMQPGFSTADVISDISGRGVGLDVVRTSIEGIRGKVDISSEAGKGSTFSIVLPLTLAIIDGMIVRSKDKTFIIPTLCIIESFRPQKASVHAAKGKEEFVQLREELLPVVRLNHKLELNNEKPNIWESTLVCIENEKGKFALLVDDLVGRQQVVIKSLGEYFSQTEGVSGGAVMGNGEVALILNIEELY